MRGAARRWNGFSKSTGHGSGRTHVPSPPSQESPSQHEHEAKHVGEIQAVWIRALWAILTLPPCCSSINKKPRSVTRNEQITSLWCVCSLHPHNFLCSSPLQASSHPGPSDACCLHAAFEIIALKPGGAPQKEKKIWHFYIFKKMFLFCSQLSLGRSSWAE